MTGASRLALRWGEFHLALQPDAGGSVAAFGWRGHSLLRSSPPMPPGEPVEPLALAGFPLMPFASRITGNRFSWPEGEAGATGRDVAVRQVRLTPNLRAEPFAIHGQSWRHPWRAEQTPSGGYRLSYEHQPDSWPWRYRAEQSFLPTATGLDLRLRLINTDRRIMPGGIGWHPYFHRGDARLSVTVTGRIRGAGDPAGPRRIPHAALDSARVAQLHLDHGFFGWDGVAEVVWPGTGLRLRLTAEEPLSFLILYTPPGTDYFCVEPVSHLPDAANWQDGLPNGWRAVAPGEALDATIRLRLDSIGSPGA